MASKTTKPRKGKRGRKVALTRHGQSVPPDIASPAFLTEGELIRREKFAQAFSAHGTLCQAAEEAGYIGSRHVLTVTGRRLYAEPAVRDRVTEILSDSARKLGITTTSVLAEYARIAFFDLGRCFDANGQMKNLPDIDVDTRRALSGYEIETKTFGSDEEAMEIENRKIKAASKDAALAVLAKHVGILKDDNEPGGRMTPEEFMERMLLARDRAMAMRKKIDEEMAPQLALVNE